MTDKQAEPTDEEDQEVLARLAANQQEDEQTRTLLSRLQALEATGQSDKEIASALASRGISRQAALRAWQQHAQDFPEHEHETTPQALQEQEATSLEERVASKRTNKPTNPLYDLQGRVSDASNQEIYQALQQAQLYLQERGGITDKEYQALNTFEEELNKRAGYDTSKQPNQAVQDIRNLGRLKIGDSYLNND